LLELLLWIWNR